MNNPKAPLVVSLLIIGLGVGWLLNTLHIIGGVDWVWTGGLGLAGILVIAAGGLNKLTFVVGPFLIIASVMSVLRQTGQLRTEIEVPTLVILAGVLMLLSQVLPLKTPQFIQEANKDKRG